jgi:hypothetical protein
MSTMTREEKHDDLGLDPGMDFGDVERVEFAPDFQVALTVPFTAEQLVALERIGAERGIGPIQAVQQLIEEATAERTLP